MIFYFLWGDPLFSESFKSLQTWVDEGIIADRRALVLTVLNLLGKAVSTSEVNYESAQRLRRLNCESEWREAQLLKHVQPDVAQTIWIEFNVSKLDPDFSFEEWVKQNDAEITARRRERGEE